MSFKKLGLIEPLLKAIKELGYEIPTTIQNRAIPLIMQKKDLFATAQTGTGKTAAFALPMIQRFRKNDAKSIKGLILSPTRELAVQIEDDIKHYAKYLDIKTLLLVSGKDINTQRRNIRKGVDIIIATPGRMVELIEQNIDLSNIEIFVLDEADRMLDMGFVKDIRKIHPILPKNHQTLLFSATFSDKVRKLSKLILNKPAFIETSKKNSTVDTINQIAYMVDTDRKAELCAYIIGSRNFPQVLVFTKTKQSADFLTEELKKDGLKVSVIHGDKTKANRLKTLNQFKEGKIKVLVATDIASRGLDIEELPFVINYELPSLSQDYVHRVGRTGRAGRDGEAISLIDIYEKYDIKEIEKVIGQKIPKEVIKGFEPDPNIRRKDIDELKLKNEHKTPTKKPSPKRSFKKTTTKKRKTTKRDKK